MSNLTQIPKSNPVVVPATTAETYDKWWLKELRVVANNPVNPIQLIAKFAPAKDHDYGNGVVAKKLQKDGEIVTLNISNVLEEANSDPSFAAVVDSVLQAVKTKAEDRDLL